MGIPIDRDTWYKPKFCANGEGYRLRVPDDPPAEQIVIHTTNGRVGSLFANECKFLAESPDVSADYIVGKQGQIVRFLIPSRHVSYGTGAAIWDNRSTIDIECHLTGGELWTEAMRHMLGELVLEVCVAYDIGDLRVFMDTHRRVAVPGPNIRKSDPTGWIDLDFYIWREMLQCKRERDHL